MATITPVNVGSAPNDNTGDLGRDGFIKLNTNIDNLNTDKLEASSIANLVTGPASAVNENITVYDSTTGKLIKDGGKTIAETLDTDNHTDGTTTKVFTDQDRQNINTNAVTGITQGGAITINGGDNTTFDMAAFTAQFVDHTAGTITVVTSSGFTGVTPTILVGETVADVFIESNGTLSFAIGVTAKQRRTKIITSRVGVPGGQGTQILDVFPRYQLGVDGDMSDRDAFDIFAPIMNVGGNNIYTANGANLVLNKSAGSIFARGSNFANDPDNPDTATTLADTGLSFRYVFRNGSGGSTVGAVVTDIDPLLYDDGSGTLQTVANNKYTTQRIYLAPNNLTLVEPGQKIYNSLNDALLDIGTSGHVRIIASSSLLRAALIVKKQATDLTVTADATLSDADELGKLGGGGSTAASGVDLQTSYNQSVQPQIVTSAVLGAMQIQRGSAADTDNVFEILNGAGTTTFSVDGNGVVDGTGITKAGVNVPSISETATLTNKDLTSGANTFPTFNQNTTGSAATLTTSRTIDNVSFDGSADIILTTSINAQTGTTYTLVLTDQSKLVTLTNAAAITLTIPTNASVAFPIGTQIDLSSDGVGAVTVAGAGVTINSLDSNLVSNGQYVGLTLIKTATDTWNLYGNLTT